MIEIQYVETHRLLKSSSNSRIHSPEQVDQIARSITEFGWTNPILIDEAMQIIAGHGRLDAAASLGIDSVPCVTLVGLTDAQKRAYLIADNQLPLNADWDLDMLKSQVQELICDGFDTSVLGFDDGFLGDLLADVLDEQIEEPEVGEPPEEPKTKLGDVWILGRHRLMCGDSTSQTAVDALMGGATIEVVFADPPYGIGLDKDGQKIGKSGSYGAVLNDDSTQVAIDCYNMASSHQDAILFFWGANYYSNILAPSSCWVAWDKQKGQHLTYADIELCYTNMDKPSRLFSHLWSGFLRDSEQGVSRVHPTQKPVQLIVEIFEFYKDALKGRSVFDPFCGSGSALLACETTKKQCYAMELSPSYCDVIVTRWQEMTGKQATLLATGECFNG